MAIRDLKVWPEPYNEIAHGNKRFEIRREDDGRFDAGDGFRVGDHLILREYDPSSFAYTGRQIEARVLHIERGPKWGIPEGMVVMGLTVYWRTAHGYQIV